MARNFLIRGMIVGVIAGLLVLGFAQLFGEPQIDLTIEFEEQQATFVADHSHGEVVSRATQSGIGITTAIVAYGVAIGGIFSLIVAFAYGRVGRIGPRATTALIAAAGSLCVVLIPDIKYPPNPPAVGNSDTIGDRTVLYFGIVAISIIVLVCAVVLGRKLMPKIGSWNAAIIASVTFIAVMALVGFGLPGIQEVSDGFPASALWRFRVASVGPQVVLWATLGLLFGYLTERSLATQRSRSKVPAGAMANSTAR